MSLGRLLAALAGIALATGCGATREATTPVAPADAVLRLTGEPCPGERAGIATVVVLDDGSGLTVAHGLEGLATLELTTAAGDTVEATVVARDDERDLAVLRLEPESAGLARAPLPEPPGEVTIVSFADAAGPVSTPTETRRRVELTLDGEGSRLGYELAGSVRPGESGGAVVAPDGRIGAVVFAASRTGDATWAVAIEEFDDLLDRAPTADPLPLAC